MAKIDLSKYLKTPEELDELYGPDIYAKVSNIPHDEQLRSVLIKDGFPEEFLPPLFYTDGIIHKFGDPNKRGDNAYWYQIHDNGLYWYGSYGSFRPIYATPSGQDRFSRIFRSIPSDNIENCDQDELEKKMNEMESVRRSKEFDDQLERIKNLRTAYDNMDDDIGNHKYLRSKQIKSTKGLKVDGLRRLVVPMYDSQNSISNVQYVSQDGSKKFETGLPSTGLFHYIPGKSDVTFICEGYATGASLNMATGQHVICAMTASNLKDLDGFIVDGKFKNPIVIADNDTPDATFPSGKGQHYASLLASKINGKVLIIDKIDDKKGSDANDYHVKHGLDALKKLIIDQFGSDGKRIGFADKYSQFDITDDDIEGMQDDEWLYKNIVVSQHLTLIVADANGGKTTIMFQEVCRKIAEAGGHKIFYFDEDSPRGEIKRKGKLIRDWKLKGKLVYLNSANKNYSADMDIIVDDIKKSIEIKENCTDVVIVFDTLRRFGSPNGKGNSAKEANGYTKLLSDFSSRCGATCILLGHCNKNRNEAGKLVFEGMTDLRANVDNLLVFDTIGSDSDDNQQVKVYADKQRAFFEDSYFKINRRTREVSILDEKPVIGNKNVETSAQSRSVDDDVVEHEIKSVLWESSMPLPFGELVSIVSNRFKSDHGLVVGKKKVTRILESFSDLRDDEYDYKKGDVYFVWGGATNNTKYYSMVKK